MEVLIVEGTSVYFVGVCVFACVCVCVCVLARVGCWSAAMTWLTFKEQCVVKLHTCIL